MENVVQRRIKFLNFNNQGLDLKSAAGKKDGLTVAREGYKKGKEIKIVVEAMNIVLLVLNGGIKFVKTLYLPEVL